MKKILFVNACVRRESRTRCLAEAVLERLEGEIREVNLEQEQIRPLDRERLEERNARTAARDFSAPIFRYARQFAEADEIVIAAPYWDLSFPAAVKLYFEAVTATGVTFRYTEEGIPEGLCRARRLLYVTTAGGPVGALNLGFDYVKGLSDTFYKIPDVRCIRLENLDLVGSNAQEMLQEKIEEVRKMQL